MQLNQIAPNMTELTIGVGDHAINVLFSYKTPVAVIMHHKTYATNKWHSRTTSKHINKYLGGKATADKADKVNIDQLLKDHFNFEPKIIKFIVEDPERTIPL